jgi:hypothetical protein
VKRYVARRLFRVLETTHTPSQDLTQAA